jgi:hypothetical protein
MRELDRFLLESIFLGKSVLWNKVLVTTINTEFT